MRFDDLFDDLESQLEAELGAEAADVRVEEERFRLGRLTMRDRVLRAPAALDLTIAHVGRMRIRRLAVGKDWLSGTLLDGAEAQCIVPFASIRAMRLDRAGVADSIDDARGIEVGLSARLSLGYVLRDLARRRVHVELLGETSVGGTIDRVGRDHCDVAVHDAGASRAEQHVSAYEVVPFASLGWVRLAD